MVFGVVLFENEGLFIFVLVINCMIFDCVVDWFGFVVFGEDVG